MYYKLFVSQIYLIRCIPVDSLDESICHFRGVGSIFKQTM